MAKILANHDEPHDATVDAPASMPFVVGASWSGPDESPAEPSEPAEPEVEAAEPEVKAAEPKPIKPSARSTAGQRAAKAKP